MNIGICIVDYGDPKLLQDCLKSFGQENDLHWNQNDNEFDITIFDCNKNNVGFSKGNNECIKKLSPCVEWIWLLNNDTTVLPETFESIPKVLEQLSPEVGIIGFKILSMDNPDLIHHAGTESCFPAGIHKSGSVKLRQREVRTNEKWVTFASVLIKREVFDQIGLLDENMFNYFSDSDFCYRARYAGFKIIYQPSFVIKHKIGQSQHPSPEQSKVLQRDAIVFQNKWLNGKTFFDLDRELV
jgi:N-acetylglucosaminyl-diphospho-decaprenol L-rhamnosyltransferase